jgi:adenine phosphoribosyltransferase
MLYLLTTFACFIKPPVYAESAILNRVMESKSDRFKQSHQGELSFLKEKIELTENFPKEGIVFEDFFPLLADPVALKQILDLLEAYYKDVKIDKIAALESRGFPLGCALADRLNVGFVPLRKIGKTPKDTYKAYYSKEYGQDGIELKKGAILENEKVLLMDDLIATGGTLKAAINLINQAGAIPCEAICLLGVKGLYNPQDFEIPLFVLLD